MFEIDLEEKIAQIALRRMEKSIGDIREEIWNCYRRRSEILRNNLKQSINNLR